MSRTKGINSSCPVRVLELKKQLTETTGAMYQQPKVSVFDSLE